MADKEVGQLNGKWSILLRFLLSTYPLVVLWTVWSTSMHYDYISFKERGDRFTKDEGAAVKTQIARMEVRLSTIEAQEMPPIWFKEKVDKLGNDMHDRFRRLEEKIDRFHNVGE